METLLFKHEQLGFIYLVYCSFEIMIVLRFCLKDMIVQLSQYHF